MSFLFELDPKDEAVADLVAEAGKKLQRAINIRGLTQNEIAQKLGVDRSRVNKCLSGFSNLTLKSLAEISWALDGKVKLDIELYGEEQDQTADEAITNVVAFVGRQTPDEQEQSAIPDPSILNRAFG
ncbi:helix-turn-helix domain-containing protein [Pararhizobium sp. DWP1-1-3]|uniref:helix-turn-helix domain-containing protein n=1 Tax=Pararhizobium sp. DWP1-1-3 TaxID=2804652 RepID=UPI003CF21D14